MGISPVGDGRCNPQIWNKGVMGLQEVLSYTTLYSNMR